jgi:K+-sensing histidine kinase KdpD
VAKRLGAERQSIGLRAAALIGAAVGIFFAWFVEITGHPSWSVLLMILCAIAPSIVVALYHRAEPRPIFLAWFRREISPWIKFPATLVLVIASLFIMEMLNVNPRDYHYLPLLPPVVLSAILLGFGPALVAVIVSTIIADFLYALPEYSFAITELEDVAGLATFAILGGFIALMLHGLLFSANRRTAAARLAQRVVR